MLIENPNPFDWRELQTGVARIFQEIGLSAEVNRVIKTSRGKIDLDVYAIDEQSVDKIQYLVECKNWNSIVPQSVVHSFTTVMHEVGGNIGFIITKKGLQSGAFQYMKNTNMIGLTYQQFQERYINIWYNRLFLPKIVEVADPISQYVETFNSFRDKKIEVLSRANRELYDSLLKKYSAFGIVMAMFESHQRPH